MNAVQTTTEAQLGFLQRLHEERGLDFDPADYANVSVADASADIDTLMRDVGSDAPIEDEQVAEINRIREFLGPRDTDTMPTDKLGGAKLLRGLQKAEWARRRELSRQKFAANGAKMNEREPVVSESAPTVVVADDDDIPF
jgi:hypothetical protein